MKRTKMSAISILASLALLSTLSGVNAQDTIQVTVATVDQAGSLLDGTVSVAVHGGAIYYNEDSPFSYEQTDGGQVAFAAQWGGLNTNWIGGTSLARDMTYTIDALGRTVTSEETPGFNEVYIVFEPIQVTTTIVDNTSNLLGGSVSVSVDSYAQYYNQECPYTYQQANGGQIAFAARWGGLDTNWVGVPSVVKDITYTIDAFTKTVTSKSTPGFNEVYIVFEPIQVTATIVDKTTNLLDGTVSVSVHDYAQYYNQEVPYTYQQADGGQIAFAAQWGGLNTNWIGVPRLVKDRTYTIDALSREVTSESTPGVNKVYIVFEPIEVTAAIVDKGSNLPDAKVSVLVYNYATYYTQDTPFTYEQANGGKIVFAAQSGGSSMGWVALPSLLKDMTYTIDALTAEVVSRSTPGVNLVNIVFATIIPATVDIDPDVLELKSEGKSVTCYIELLEGYDVVQIDVTTILLNDAVFAESAPTEVEDNDGDGIPDLKVKFDRSAVEAVVDPGDRVEITVTGELTDGTRFIGSDTIRVID